MKSRAVRLTLFLLFVITIGATGYLFWLGDTRSRAEGEAARGFEAGVQAAVRGIDRLRASQQAYVAAGQGDQVWAGKVTSTLAEVKDSIQRLRASSAAPDAQAAADTALAILQDFEQMDRRARDYARSGQLLLASDLIFGDGLDLTAAAAAAVHQAGIAERQAQDGTLEGIRRRQLYAVASGAAAALLVVLLLLPAGRSDEPDAEAVESEASQGGRLITEPDFAVADEGWSPAAVVRAAQAPDPSTAPPPSPPPMPASSVELAAIASICTDLARLSDTQALSALLGRAAASLDASGIVLWIADPDGRELAPILTHGYSQSIVNRLGTIPRDAENATAAALRTSLLQTVRTDSVSEGAIAAPLLTPAGCVGVMAAEVRHHGEQDEMKLAAATIVAAQLATLVGPPSSKARAEATG